MTDEEILEELEGALAFSKEQKEYHLKKIAFYDELIARDTRLIELIKKK